MQCINFDSPKPTDLYEFYYSHGMDLSQTFDTFEPSNVTYDNKVMINGELIRYTYMCAKGDRRYGGLPGWKDLVYLGDAVYGSTVQKAILRWK